MKTKRYADETEGYNTENKTELNITFYTEAQSPAMEDVLERVVEATLQSGMRFMKHTMDEGEGSETVFLNAEDCSASVVASFVRDVKDLDHELSIESVVNQYGSNTKAKMDSFAILYESEELKAEPEKEEEEIETDEQN